MKRRIFRCGVFLSVAGLPLQAGAQMQQLGVEAPVSDAIVNIGTQKQFFFDDRILEWSQHVLPHANRSIGIAPQKPWEPPKESVYSTEEMEAHEKVRLVGFVYLEATESARRYMRKYQLDNDPTEQVAAALLTKPLYSTGNRLVINADASEGFIKLELLDLEGNVIPGYGLRDSDAFQGDSLAHAMTWNGKSAIGDVFPARFRFHMEKAKLYTLQVKN